MSADKLNPTFFKVAFDGFYSRILQVVARSLHQTKMFSFSIEYLQQENPSYKERADVLSEIHAEMNKLSEALGLDYQASVIGEYVDLMHELANAIDEGNEDRLNAVIEVLDQKPFICL